MDLTGWRRKMPVQEMASASWSLNFAKATGGCLCMVTDGAFFFFFILLSYSYFEGFPKYSVSHPSVGTYAARRSQVEVLKEINWNVRTSKPGKRRSPATLFSICFLTYSWWWYDFYFDLYSFSRHLYKMVDSCRQLTVSQSNGDEDTAGMVTILTGQQVEELCTRSAAMKVSHWLYFCFIKDENNTQEVDIFHQG